MVVYIKYCALVFSMFLFFSWFFEERDVPSRQWRRFERMDLIAVFDRMRFVEGSRKRVIEKGAMD